MNNKQILILFLKKHRKYSSFKRQVINDIRSENAKTYSILLRGFHIEGSEEGLDYWIALNTKWNRLVTDFNLDINEIIDLTTL